MATFRDIKRQARRTLHERLSEPAWFLATPEDTPVATRVRLHLSFGTPGDLRNGGFAEVQEYNPRIVFLDDTIAPANGSVVVTRDAGAWWVDNTLPPDDITVAAEVMRFTDSQVTDQEWTASADYMGLGDPEAV